MFPVHEGISSPVTDQTGGDSKNRFVSAYELYAVDFGSSADKVFATKDQHPYVGGGFVWSGWDYLGEPTPYYLSRSTYFGIIDLAGFKKDRFYLYQARWRPDHPMVHILPHWNWPDRLGQVTPVHLFTSGDEAELFLNGKSLGRKQKEAFQYRLRWENVQYQPGELKAIAYKDGEVWAESTVRTTGPAEQLVTEADRDTLSANGRDLSFITLRITDKNGDTVPDANHPITFTVDGPGQIVGTDNGDPTDMTPFPSVSRNAFNGLCLVIVSSKKGATGAIQIKAESDGLQGVAVTINAN
jgi:beta-galactosidase